MHGFMVGPQLQDGHQDVLLCVRFYSSTPKWNAQLKLDLCDNDRQVVARMGVRTLIELGGYVMHEHMYVT